MTHNDSQVEALPCPFCGEHPAFDSTDERTRLHCSGCGSEGGLFFFSQEECESGIGDATEARAIAAWNRRTALSALAAGKVEAIPEDDEFTAGVNAAAAMLDKMADDYAAEYGSVDPDTGTGEFRSSAREEHYNTLRELADDVRSIVHGNASPSPLSADPDHKGNER